MRASAVSVSSAARTAPRCLRPGSPPRAQVACGRDTRPTAPMVDQPRRAIEEPAPKCPFTLEAVETSGCVEPRLRDEILAVVGPPAPRSQKPRMELPVETRVPTLRPRPRSGTPPPSLRPRVASVAAECKGGARRAALTSSADRHASRRRGANGRSARPTSVLGWWPWWDQPRPPSPKLGTGIGTGPRGSRPHREG